MGKERYKRQQWGLAIPHFDTALQLQPDHFWANTLSALCCLGLQRYSEARIRLNSCLQREPDYPWLYVWRGFASSHVAAQAAGPVEKPPSDENTLAKDVELQFQAAESDYRRALELLEQKPDEALRYVLLINRGLLELQRRKWDQADADWQEAIRLDGRRYQALGELASLYLRENKPDAAIEQFSRAVALQPDLAVLYRAAPKRSSRTRPRPRISGREPCATWSRRFDSRSPAIPWWRGTTPIGADYWTTRAVTRKPSRPSRPP